MKVNTKNLSKFVLDDLNEIDCIYFNPISYELVLEATNGCFKVFVLEYDDVAKIEMEHANEVDMDFHGYSEVVTNSFLADIKVTNLSVELYFENDMMIMFRLKPIVFHDDGETYPLDDLELISYYQPLKKAI